MKLPIELDTIARADKRLLEHTDKNGKVLYGYAITCDNLGNYFLLPVSQEAAFGTWAATGKNDGEFDDFRVSPPGAMIDLIFSRPSSVN